MDEKYNLAITIPYNLLNEDYIKHSIDVLKKRGAEAVFDEIYNANHPTIVETHIEMWDRFDVYPCRVYQLHYRLTAVLYRNIEIPVFTFTNHEGKVEWKCPACGMINSIEATYCGEKHHNAVGCGSPREKTRQWYESQYMGVFSD